MSELTRRRRDAGMTLPELLIAVTILGMLVTVMAGAVVVTLRQTDSTEGRVNVARSEQNVGFYMPHDLASAATVDTDPSLTPCPGGCPAGIDLNGSNALMMSWTKLEAGVSEAIEVTTNVSYHFAPSDDDPTLFQLRRIVCTSTAGGPWSCESLRVLSDLDGPPGGGLFIAGDTVPNWVLQVSEPLAPDATNETQFASFDTRKDANRVVVTINGGGVGEGSGGGSNQVSITAGGTTRSTIVADSVVNAPSFAEARSRCGGPVALIVDDSGSIGSWMGAVEDGVKTFVETFAGTPTQLQIVRFDSTAGVVGAGAAWSKYFDLSLPDEVDALRAAVAPGLTAGGATNWEDAWFRTFYESNGDLQQVIPETVVFFTDGQPTSERLRERSSPGQLISDSPPAPAPGWPTDSWGRYSNGSDYSQVAFDRTDWIVDSIRGGTRIIGVGVGGITTGTSDWIGNPGAGYHYQYERGYRQYQKAPRLYEKREIDYQRRVSWGWYSWWVNISYSDYLAGNVDSGDSDGYREVSAGWGSTSQADYDANNTTTDESDGYRTTRGSWQWISAAEYVVNNSTGDESDGYRDAGKSYVSSDSAAVDWEPTTEERTDDGYRQSKVYTAPFSYTDPPISYTTSNETILSRLVSGNDNAVRGHLSNGVYDNADVAELYILPDIDKFALALEAVALAECGGTLSVSTKVNGGARAADPFTFQNSIVVDSSGTKLDVEPTVVNTSKTFPVGTFDFTVPGGDYVTVEIIPQNLSDLTGYSPAGWTCQSGITPRIPEVITIPDSTWTGVRLTVAANEALSCVMGVSK